MALPSLIYEGLFSRAGWKTLFENGLILSFLLYFFNSMDYYKFFMYSMNKEEGDFRHLHP
jgi:hypothetical protein